MSYLNSITLGAVGDGPHIDAFGRLRISSPFTIFDSKQIFDDGTILNTAENFPLFYDNQQVSGSGTSTAYNANQASTTLSVSNTTAGKRVRQTKQRMNYQPGKSQYIFLTGVLGAGVSGVTKRYGYFDDNNGLFFELDDTTLSVVRRSYVTGSAVDTKVAQASWNIDPMDGSGPSGVTIDLEDTQIFVMDFEWLGVGRVRFGFVIGGIIHYCHEFLNANSLSTVYMSTPNLPVRMEIENDGTGAAAEVTEICASVISEGGFDPNGVVRSHDSGITNVTVGTTEVALLGIRLRSSHLGMTVIPQSVSVVVTSANDVLRWALLLNPTVAGTFAYSDLTNSGCQVATGSATNTVTGGTRLDSGYASSDTRQTNLTIETAIKLGATIAGTQDTLVLVAQAFSATLDAVGSMSWREVT